MIAACPHCEARYRLDESRVGPEGARLRCARCRSLFRLPSHAFSPASQEVSGPSLVEGEAGESPSRANPLEVFVVDAQPQRARETTLRLESLGISVVLESDGVEALLRLQQTKCSLVVVASDVSRISGWDLCEIIKSSAHLEPMGVVLLADRSTRPEPSGVKRLNVEPDLLIDSPASWSGLNSVLDRYGIPHSDRGNDTPITHSSVEPKTLIETALAQPDPRSWEKSEPLVSGLDAERGKAERLSRIVVSDMLLYHPDRFDRVSDEKELLAVFESELLEGTALLEKRVKAAVLCERDFLREELLRAALQRSQG